MLRLHSITRSERHPGLFALSLAAVLLLVTTVHAGATPAQKCQKAKLKAAGQETARAMMGCWAKTKATGLPVNPTCLSDVQARADAAISKAGGACPGTASAIDTAVDNCVGALLDADPFTGNCGAGSAKAEGRAAGDLASCTARDVVTPNHLLVCDTKIDSRLGEALVNVGGCVASAAVEPLLDTCTRSVAFLVGVCPLETMWGTQGGGSGQFNYPVGVAVDASGNVFVADTNNDRIQKFDNGGTFITTWNVAPFVTSPVGVAVDASGDVFEAESGQGDDSVREFDNGGTFITTWGGPGQFFFFFPAGVAVDASGNVFVANYSDRILKFDNGGTFITTWGIPGNGPGQFNLPVGVAVDASGNVFVADGGNDRIQKFDNGGTFITTWGIPGNGPGQFNRPVGIAVDASGNVFVVDEYNHRIQRFDNGGTFITTWGIPEPMAVAVDASENVFVADAGNNRILKFACP